MNSGSPRRRCRRANGRESRPRRRGSCPRSARRRRACRRRARVPGRRRSSPSTRAPGIPRSGSRRRAPAHRTAACGTSRSKVFGIAVATTSWPSFSTRPDVAGSLSIASGRVERRRPHRAALRPASRRPPPACRRCSRRCPSRRTAEPAADHEHAARAHGARHRSPSGWMRARPAAKLAASISPATDVTHESRPLPGPRPRSRRLVVRCRFRRRPARSSSPAAQARDAEVARSIWEYAEVGYQETKSSALLQQELTERGLQGGGRRRRDSDGIRRDAGQRQAGDRHPRRVRCAPGHQPGRRARPQADRGQARQATPADITCSARLRSPPASRSPTGSRRAARPGTIRVYGTPAEEGGSGKVYMVRAGLFNDVDAVMHWHPSDVNFAGVDKCAREQVREVPVPRYLAHASGAPERAARRSTASRPWTHMSNLMREHIPSDARMHYVITSGGAAPNVVPDFAEVLLLRAPLDPRRLVESIFDRLVKICRRRGARHRHDRGSRGHRRRLHPARERRARARDEREAERGRRLCLHARGAGLRREDLRDLMSPSVELGSHAKVQAYDFERPGLGSTDVGDVSWTVPTVGLRTATWVPGTPAHTWQATAAGGMSIGYKGMNVASQTLALPAASSSRARISSRKPRAEFAERRGTGFPVPGAARRSCPGPRLPQGRSGRRQLDHGRST